MKSLSAKELYDIEGAGVAAGSAADASRWTLKEYEDELASPRSCLFVSAQVRGFVLYRSLGEGEYEIMNLAVAEKGKGGGSLILGEFLKSLPEGDSTKVFLEVRASNLAAQKLYKKFNFHSTGLRKSYYRNGESAVLMSKVPAT